MLPQALAFSRNRAGKPALAWGGFEGGAVDEAGAHLQFNLSHTSSLLGARMHAYLLHATPLHLS